VSWSVVVPTYDHAALIGRQTLRLVEETELAPERVWLFVADEAERERYATACPAWAERLFVAERGLQNARRLAHGYFAEGERVLWLDDDLRGLRRLVSRERMEPVSLAEVAEEGFGLCEQAGSHLWGIYPSANAFYMKPRVRADLSYCIGCFYGTLVRHEEELHPRFGDPKEDYERTLRYWERDGVVVRLDYVCPLTAYYRPGPNGDRLGRTLARVERNIAAIEGRWPELVRRGRTKRYGFPEMRLVQPQATTV
jgi:hypothetical protein